jgi:DNA replication protein DnaC
MAFDVKYHIQAENELAKRRTANLAENESRRRKLEAKNPEFVRQRRVMASTGAKLAAAVFSGDAAEKVEQIHHENMDAARRIKELLTNLNLPHSYLDPIYTCKVCQDTGIAKLARCDCYTSTVKRLAAAGINSNSPLTLTGFDTFDIEHYPDAADPERGVNIREVMRQNFEFCKSYAEDFHLPDAGLLLVGQTGLGKTHLSLAIAGRVLSKGFNAVYGSAPDLFGQIKDEHFGKENGNTAKTLQAAELLVLDDIGAEFDSEFFNAAFYNLLNSRLNSGKPTIISTNYTMKELKERYATRITSRLLTMEMLQFFGNDIRLIKRRSGS